ncbi:solute carrier family 45 member 3 [Rhinatrema bivittatum]|uniref:solute carrier family 45 member 3 n=1 Tax=Rhinatrema bivittatum TaxID=194408 RepID=UPI00112EA8D4|nr:solute carrier family 45 member 3 [Rhinatrema bivittatum]XP_029428769.1 solute carrier family 45 member 3 [Rhinatrema bivittatum]
MPQKASGHLLFQSRRAQLLLVNSFTCGLEVCLAVGTTYVPPFLLEAGVEETFMTMVLGIGPVLALFLVPLIGSASDHWISSYGRRRPFIWFLCLGVLLGLLIIPHANRLAAFFSRGSTSMEIAFLILGICMLDFCGQACFTPLEALLSDLFQDADNCRQAFSIYSFMVSLGGCIGYLLPAINWKQSFLAAYVGGQEECLFSLLVLIFLGCMLATLFVREEVVVPPMDLRDERAMKDLPRPLSVSCCFPGHLSLLLFWARHLLLALRNVCTLVSHFRSLCCCVPQAIRRLFMAKLCSWMALMTFLLFYTDFIGEGLYRGVPMAKAGTEARRRYDEGIRMGSLGLFLQCTVSILFSTIMGRLVTEFGTRAVYLASVGLFPLAACIMCLSNSIVIVTASAALTGVTFSTLQILPYTLASLYHHEKQIFLPKYKGVEEEEVVKETKQPYLKGPYPNGLFSLPASDPSLCRSSPCEVSMMIAGGAPEPKLPAPGRGICLDLAILDSAFLLSQVVPSLLMGAIVQFTQSVTSYMVSAAGFGLVAIYFATKVIFDKSDMAQCSVS